MTLGPQAILWDNDGVLVDTEQIYFDATRETLGRVGVELTRDQYVELFLRQARGAWHLAEERGTPPDVVERLRQERNAIYGRLLAEREVAIPGVESVLAALHGRYRMGIVTSSRRDHFDMIHRNTGLLKYFDFVLTSSDYTKMKPDPEPYVTAVRRIGLPREACLAVEDSERGLTAAVAAGVPCVVVPTPLTRDGDFSTARRVLENIAELLPLLGRGPS